MKKHFHVIWTSFGTYQVWDNRGHWAEMYRRYELLKKRGVQLDFHYELPEEYLNRPYPSNQRTLDSKQQGLLQNELTELTTPGSYNLEISYINCTPNYVELVAATEEAKLKQRMVKLKSRTAALLNLQYPEQFSGKSTWGKGFWTVEIIGNTEMAIWLLQNEY